MIDSEDPKAKQDELIEQYDLLFEKAAKEAVANFNGDTTTDRRVQIMTDLLIEKGILPPSKTRNRPSTSR
jgi:hypothetical protein